MTNERCFKCGLPVCVSQPSVCVCSLFNLHPSAGGAALPVQRPDVPTRSAVPDLTLSVRACARVCACVCIAA